MTRWPTLFLILVLSSGSALAQRQYPQGSLIIPMDVTYQDYGMLQAFGLLHRLLKNNVPVQWVIKAKKSLGDPDITVVSKDFKTGAVLPPHGYRGGPFVVEAGYVNVATPIITAWQKTSPMTAVHIAQQDFTGRPGRILTAAPSIAVIADKNQAIAFSYMNAAGIPDRNGNLWSNSSPDVLEISAITGPTTTQHNDGALFRPSGQPAYCQIMTMHWDVNDVVDEVVAEYRSFLQFPTHMMAECQAVNAIENNVNGHFITPHGFVIDNHIKSEGPFEFLNLDTPFVQMDGPFLLEAGSERAYSLPPGDTFYDKNVVMIKDISTNPGKRSIWMTGYMDGTCVVTEGATQCTAGVGKVSYLGGHRYDVLVPLTQNPSTQGTRLFLNSLFEAGCATAEGQPFINLIKKGPKWTTSATVTYSLSYTNSGPGPALDLVFSDELPPGVTYVSSTGGGTLNGSTVTWSVGDVGSASGGSVELTVTFSDYGTYTNSFKGAFNVGVSPKTAQSNLAIVEYLANLPADAGPPDRAVVDGRIQDQGGINSDKASPSDGGVKDGTAERDGALGDAPSDRAAKDGVTDILDGKIPLADGSPDGKYVVDLPAKDLPLSPAKDSKGPGADGTWIASGSGGCDCRMEPTRALDGLLGVMLALALMLGLRRRR